MISWSSALWLCGILNLLVTSFFSHVSKKWLLFSLLSLLRLMFFCLLKWNLFIILIRLLPSRIRNLNQMHCSSFSRLYFPNLFFSFGFQKFFINFCLISGLRLRPTFDDCVDTFSAVCRRSRSIFSSWLRVGSHQPSSSSQKTRSTTANSLTWFHRISLTHARTFQKAADLLSFQFLSDVLIFV